MSFIVVFNCSRREHLKLKKKYWENAHEPPIAYLIRIRQAYTPMKILNPPLIDLYFIIIRWAYNTLIVTLCLSYNMCWIWWIIWCVYETVHSKHPTLVYCWPIVYDVGPTVKQRWANVSCRPTKAVFKTIFSIRDPLFKEACGGENKIKLCPRFKIHSHDL